LSTDQLPGHYNQSVAPGLDVTPRQCRLPALGTMDDQASVSCPTITGSERPPRGHPIHQFRAAPSRHTLTSSSRLKTRVSIPQILSTISTVYTGTHVTAYMDFGTFPDFLCLMVFNCLSLLLFLTTKLATHQFLSILYACIVL